MRKEGKIALGIAAGAVLAAVIALASKPAGAEEKPEEAQEAQGGIVEVVWE